MCAIMQKLRVNSMAMRAALCERAHPRSIGSHARAWTLMSDSYSVAQWVERLVRNESGLNSLTLSQTVVSAPPRVKDNEPRYLTLSLMPPTKCASGQRSVISRRGVLVIEASAAPQHK